jgi:hypothetical protein
VVAVVEAAIVRLTVLLVVLVEEVQRMVVLPVLERLIKVITVAQMLLETLPAPVVVVLVL